MLPSTDDLRLKIGQTSIAPVCQGKYCYIQRIIYKFLFFLIMLYKKNTRSYVFIIMSTVVKTKLLKKQLIKIKLIKNALYKKIICNILIFQILYYFFGSLVMVKDEKSKRGKRKNGAVKFCR